MSSQVALRPEPFGALAYHFGNRKMVFLKTRELADVVRALSDGGQIQSVFDRVGVPQARRDACLAALAALADAGMIVQVEQ